MKEFAEFLNSLNENVWAAFFALLGVGLALASVWYREIFPAATSLLWMAALAFRGSRENKPQ